jgi:hypothetical protein
MDEPILATEGERLSLSRLIPGTDGPSLESRAKYGSSSGDLRFRLSGCGCVVSKPLGVERFFDVRFRVSR